MLSILANWATTLSLVFGGCCSNAISLEQLTLEYPNAGSVLTLFQFLVISLHGLPKFIVWTRFGPRFRPRRVPITRYLLQVGLFYLVSLLNNAAFGYSIPMAVHIIFRSGGLIVSLVLGWLIAKKIYSTTQILSVLLVTIGVIITTLSAQLSSAKSTLDWNPYTYSKGIGILTLALILSGVLGLLQDWTHLSHGKPSLSSNSNSSLVSNSPPSWQESMFYLHFLALPMFLPLLPNLASQMEKINNTGPRAEFSFPIPIPVMTNSTALFPMNISPTFSLPNFPIFFFPESGNSSLLAISLSAISDDTPDLLRYPTFSFSIPYVYIPLVVNTITQLVCVAGVNRLITTVSTLTVTLVLVVRKAVSLIISVIGVSQVGKALWDVALFALDAISNYFGMPSLQSIDWGVNSFGIDFDSILVLVRTIFVGVPASKPPQQVDNKMMWTGASMVLIGTIGYALGSRSRKHVEQKGKTE